MPHLPRLVRGTLLLYHYYYYQYYYHYYCHYYHYYYYYYYYCLACHASYAAPASSHLPRASERQSRQISPAFSATWLGVG